MSDSPDEAPLNLVHGDSVPREVNEDLSELHQQVAASEENIAKLQGELKAAADQEAQTAQRFDSERQLRAALDQQLHEAREEATRLMLDDATRTRNVLLAEAQGLLQTARGEAEREAGQISKQAIEKANEMVAIAKREGAAIVDAAREEARALEEDAARRMADLDTEHRELTHQLGAMETTYDKLRATLERVAETSIEELVNTQDSVKQLDRVETHEPPAEPKGEPDEQTTPGSPPKESSPTDLDTPSRFARLGQDPTTHESQRTQADSQHSSTA